MAGLRKLKDKYYSRIWYRNDQGKRKEKLIPLNTKSKRRAKKLQKQVTKQEQAFKQGIITLDEIDSKKVTNLQKLIDQFMEYLRASDRSEKTLSLYDLALNKTLLKIYPKTNIELISDYTYFIKEIRKQYPNNTTCNIRLRSIRAFFNWC